jgi:hypothetical protein
MWLARTFPRPEPPGLDILDQGIEGPIEHLSDITAGHCMAEQLLSSPKLVVSALRDRETKEKTLRNRVRANLRWSKFGPALTNLRRSKFATRITVNFR